jgi:biotin carboxylase
MSRNKTKTVVILGGGIMQLPSIKTAREMNWTVILIDGDDQAVGREYANYFEQIDLKDKERIEQVVRSYQNKFQVHGIFTAGTDFSTSVAWVAEKLNLPGIPYETAVKATDKERMRRVFKECKIASPGFLLLNSLKEMEKVLFVLSFPLVVKPADNMGARGVKRVDTCQELKEAVQTGFVFSRSHRVIVEEYMEGPEFSIDAIVHKGKITICGIADRHICFSPYFIEMGHTMPTNFNPQIKKALVRIFKRGIQALGITEGAAKGDIKLSPSGPMIGEIAARLSGGFMSGWTYPYSSGVEVTRAALRMAAGLPPSTLKPRFKHTSAERAFISIPGIVHTINGVEEAKNTKGVMDVFLKVAAGSRVTFPRNNIEKCGNVISKSPDRKQAVASAEQSVQKIFLRLEPGNKETEEFLFKDSFPTIQCFSLTIKKNLEALKSMKPSWGQAVKLNRGNLFIKALPSLQEEKVCDWHGLQIQAALDKVLQYTGVHLRETTSDNEVVLGKIFWQAFLKGGTQGGVYIIDTLLKGGNKKMTFNN